MVNPRVTESRCGNSTVLTRLSHGFFFFFFTFFFLESDSLSSFLDPDYRTKIPPPPPRNPSLLTLVDGSCVGPELIKDTIPRDWND